MSDEEVIIRVEGQVGRLTLNRPAALGALTLNMCHRMTEALLAWEDDPEIRLVMIDHAGERGFCAGGDIRFLYESIRAGDGGALKFFHDEYQLDHLLFVLNKSAVVFMDGLVMGGGSGISMPCRYRVATERTVFAMPETGIGLFPDVGASRFLSRLPGKAGLYMALTGARMKAADCLALGLATHYLPAADLEAQKAAIIADPEHVAEILGERHAEAGPPPYGAIKQKVDRAFSAPDVETIVAHLERDADWGAGVAETIRKKSPLLQKVALRELAEGADKTSYEATLAMEYRMVNRIIPAHDFSEGVRATIIEKDGAPNWSPKTLEDVTDEMVEAVFAPLKNEWTPLKAAQGREDVA